MVSESLSEFLGVEERVGFRVIGGGEAW